MGSKKAKDLVYFHSTCLLAWKGPGYREGPSNLWDEYVDDAICLAEEIQIG